jgi:hypothetical protein
MGYEQERCQPAQDTPLYYETFHISRREYNFENLRYPNIKNARTIECDRERDFQQNTEEEQIKNAIFSKSQTSISQV